MSQSTINHFEITLKMLNESMGMCLPTKLVMVDVVPEEWNSSLREMEASEEVSSQSIER